MQRIMESIFDIIYLITVITLGIQMLRQAKTKSPFRLFGAMAVVLGCGDAFHLVPRVYAQWTTGMEANAAALGLGQLVTSITMTVFYVLLYQFWRKRYRINGQKGLSAVIYLLAAVRVVLCLMPQNDWMSPNAPVSWGIYRNIPFALLGLIIIVLFFIQAHKQGDRAFRWMWLAITLSFGFYIPVVLFASAVPAVGALMIPKTCAYVWIVWMGYHELKQGRTLR